MADDHNARYRSNDPYGHASAANQPSGDPLAELARLIGQSDPFAELGRSSAAPAATPNPSYESDRSQRYENEPEPYHAPQYSDDRGAPAGWREAAASPPPTPAFDPFAQAVHQAPAEGEQHYDSRAFHDPNNFAPLHSHELEALSRSLQARDSAPPASRQEPQSYGRQEPQSSAQPESQSYEQPEPQSYAQQEPQSYSQDAYTRTAQTQEQTHDTHGHRAADPFQQSSEPPTYAQPAPPMADPQAFPISPPPFHRTDGGMPRSEEFYEDDAQGGRRKGLVTVIAVLCLAVLGTAGAFAYRSMFSGPDSSSAPPVIRASVEPNKIMPPPVNVDPATSKLSYDRFGDRGQNEQVVAREEQPVDTRDLVRSSPSRVVPGAPNGGAGASPQAAVNPPSVLGEPKRVRTVPIRPDQAESAPARAQASAPPPAAPQRQSVVASAPVNEPVELSPPASRASAPARTTIASRQAQQQPQASANVPLSLAPENGSSPPPARDVAPPRAPVRTASTGGGGSGFHVQISSQRSEADAQTSYRSIQSKYSGVLGDRQAVIRRADLGDKGTYYRAMIGPFSTREQAIQLCGSLKAAGGDCVVQSN